MKIIFVATSFTGTKSDFYIVFASKSWSQRKYASELLYTVCMTVSRYKNVHKGVIPRENSSRESREDCFFENAEG